MEIPELIQVNSSNIDVVAWDEQGLFVGFKGASEQMWFYAGVPMEQYLTMMKAESIGAYYAKVIKPVYSGVRLHNIDGLWKILK